MGALRLNEIDIRLGTLFRISQWAAFGGPLSPVPGPGLGPMMGRRGQPLSNALTGLRRRTMDAPNTTIELPAGTWRTARRARMTRPPSARSWACPQIRSRARSVDEQVSADRRNFALAPSPQAPPRPTSEVEVIQ